MWAFAALQAGSAISNYAQGSAEAKYNKKLQAYNNAQAVIAGNNELSINNLNRQLTLDNSVQQSLEVQRNALLAQGEARVQSAFAGVAGGSSQAVLQDILRNAARAQGQLDTDLLVSTMQLDQTAMGIAAGTQRAQTRNVFNKPNLVASVLNVGTNVVAQGQQTGVGFKKPGYGVLAPKE